MQRTIKLIEQITKIQPSISLEGLLDELEYPAFLQKIPVDEVVKTATLFIAKRNAIQTGVTQIVTHKTKSATEIIEVTPN